MRVLLDTQLLIWSLRTPERLDAETRSLIRGKATTLLFSSVSIWEIAIKASLRRADFMMRPEVVTRAALKAGFVALPVDTDVVAGVADLPPHHRDPFDRLLVVQAMAEPAWLYTADPVLSVYSELVKVVR